MKIAYRLLLVSAAAICVSSIVQAQAPAPDSATSDGTDAPAADPTAFVKGAAMGALAEVELAKLARSKSQNATIRSFADRMIRDHGKANTELAAIARRKGFDVPTSLNSQDEDVVKEGAARSGMQFDAWYASRMVIEHEKAVALFESATMSADADLAAFARKTLPTLREHQQMAAKLPGT